MFRRSGFFRSGATGSGISALKSEGHRHRPLSTMPARPVTSWFVWMPSEIQTNSGKLVARQRGKGQRDDEKSKSPQSKSGEAAADKGSEKGKASSATTKKDINDIVEASSDKNRNPQVQKPSPMELKASRHMMGLPAAKLGTRKAPIKDAPSLHSGNDSGEETPPPTSSEAGEKSKAREEGESRASVVFAKASANLKVNSVLKNNLTASGLSLTELLRKNEGILRRQREAHEARQLQLQKQLSANNIKQQSEDSGAASTQGDSPATAQDLATGSDTNDMAGRGEEAALVNNALHPSDVSYFEMRAADASDSFAVAAEVCELLEEEEELKVELSSGVGSLGEIPLVPNAIYYRTHPEEAAAIRRNHRHLQSTSRRFQHSRSEDDLAMIRERMPIQPVIKADETDEDVPKRDMVPIPPKLIIRVMKKRPLTVEQLKECRRQLEERMAAAGVQVGQAQKVSIPTGAKPPSGGSQARANANSAPSTITMRTVASLDIPEAAPFEWIDVQSHPAATLQEYRTSIVTLLLGLRVHETLIQATMESVILPQFSLVDGCHCLVLRSAVEDATSFEMDSIQELTNRLTILVFKETGRVVTIHRAPMQFVEEIVSIWAEEYAEGVSPPKLLSLLTKEAVRTYHKAISNSIVQFDGYEARLFAPQRQRATLAREIYHIKRRASVYSRTLALLQEAYITTAASLNVQSFDAYLQDVQQDIVHVRSLSDELSDNANTVLQLLFQLSSYQLNELMRVLTMFSAFFIPLSFIASVYGMNFEDLPMIDSDWGPVFCFALMAVVSTTIVTWFRMKGFW